MRVFVDADLLNARVLSNVVIRCSYVLRVHFIVLKQSQLC